MLLANRLAQTHVERDETQQIIQDTRLPLMDYDRVFPHNEKESKVSAESRGLLWQQSFIEGLSPLAFFVHAIAGRDEGLLPMRPSYRGIN